VKETLMSLLTLITDTQAILDTRRDVPSANMAFNVLRAASSAFESTAPVEQFVTWAYAGQSAEDGRRTLEPLAGDAAPLSVSAEPEEADEAARSMAKMSSLLSEVLVDNATDEPDPEIRLGLLAAARHATEIHCLLSG